MFTLNGKCNGFNFPNFFTPITSKKQNKMKKIFSRIMIVVGIVATTSCADEFLDQTSPSEMTDETVWNSTYYTSLRINKLYAGMVDGDRTYDQDITIKWGLNSDVELVDGLGSNATNSTHYRGVGNYNASPAFSNFSNSWDDMYAIIEDANLNIEGIRGSSLLSTSDSTTMKRYLGESLTIRAMIYFDLLRYFGDIPLKLESSRSDLSNAYTGKTDRDAIMDTLMIDLEEAINYLPWADDVSGYTTERVTKGYAHGLLAQIALTRAGWAIREEAKSGYETATDYSDPVYPTQRPDADTRKSLYEKALEHLSAIISNGVHQLNPSFYDEWYLLNQLTLDKSYHENIFEIPMGLGDSGELGYTVGVRINGTNTLYGYSNSSGVMKVTAMLFYSYDPADTRRDITCSPIQIVQSGSQTVEEMLGNTPFAIYVGKWDPRMMSDTWKSQNLVATAKQGYGINPVKLRYSQVLLYYAEVMNELAGSPDARYDGDAGITAREALAQVHNRAFDSADLTEAQAYINNIPSDKESFFDAIVQENAWELAGEGMRKWDLIRWNLLVPKIKESKELYLQYLQDGTFKETVYFNYSDAAKTQIDMLSITWYTDPADITASDYDGSESSYGSSDITDTNDTQVYTNLPSISSGLVGSSIESLGISGTEPSVVNRYLMPIGSTTISASNGTLQNSYGYTN